jgi:hypothetical protein
MFPGRHALSRMRELSRPRRGLGRRRLLDTGQWLARPNSVISAGTRRVRTRKESSSTPIVMQKANSRNGTSGTIASSAKLPASASPATPMARLARGAATRTASRSGMVRASCQIRPTTNTL